MIKQYARTLLALVLFALISMFGIQCWATGQSDSTDSLPVEDFHFDPPFITVGDSRKIKIEATLPGDSPIFPGSELDLNVQRFRSNGKSKYDFITKLYKTGTNDEGDIIFTGEASFQKNVSGTLQFQVVAEQPPPRRTLISTLFSIPVYQHECGPIGTILPVQVFEGKEGAQPFEAIEFEVPAHDEPNSSPTTAKAFLRLVNGARIGAPKGDRFEYAQVEVNGKKVLIPSATKKDEKVDFVNDDINVAEAPIEINTGTPYRLEIKNVKANSQKLVSEQSLTAQIDVCPDKLELTPISDTQFVGGQTLEAEATLTGLGIPIPNALIEFSLPGFTNQTSTTSGDGTARATFPSFAQAMPATKITASAVWNTSLQNSVDIQVAETPTIDLRQSNSSLIITEDEPPTAISYYADLFKQDTLAYEAQFEQTVEPDDEGIILKPNGEIKIKFKAPKKNEINNPRTEELPVSIEGAKPGHYTVTSLVTITVNGVTETKSMSLGVDVLPKNETLVLSPPTIQPGSIGVETPSDVVFQTTVKGAKSLPSNFPVEVQQCNPEEGVCTDSPTDPLWEPKGELHDNGLDTDSLAGDGVFSGKIQVTGNEGQLLYRVGAKYKGQLFVSGANILQVSSFPDGSDPTPSEMIEDTAGTVIAGEQVLVRFVPSTTSARIKNIVRKVTSNVTGQSGDVVGQIAQIGVFQVKLNIDGAGPLTEAERFALVNDAVEQFKTFDEVLSAEPNHAAFSANFTTFPPWSIPRIRADKAWSMVTSLGGSPGKGVDVAIIDNGVNQNHIEIKDQLKYNSVIYPDAELGFDDDNISPGHGTGVAALIAAENGNGGISGIAYNSEIYSIKAGEVLKLEEGLIKASLKQDVRVINVSKGVYRTQDNSLECALLYAANPQDKTFDGEVKDSTGKLCGAQKSAVCTRADEVCSGKSQGKLVVWAAGNEGVDTTNTPIFPCRWTDRVICVGNSTVDKPKEVISAPDNTAIAIDLIYDLNQTAWGYECGSNKKTNHGFDVDIFAPGTCIKTASNDGTNAYALLTGTSFSAPHVSGAAAVLFGQNTELDADTVRLRLTSFVKPLNFDANTSKFTLNKGFTRNQGLLDVTSALQSGNILSGKAWLTTNAPSANDDWKGKGVYDSENKLWHVNAPKWQKAIDNASEGANKPNDVCSVTLPNCKETATTCSVTPECENTQAKFMWHPNDPNQAYFYFKFWVNPTYTPSVDGPWCKNLILDAQIIADDYFEIWVNGSYIGNRLLGEHLAKNYKNNPGRPKPISTPLRCGDNVVAIRANDGDCVLDATTNKCSGKEGSGKVFSRGYRSVFFDGKIVKIPNPEQ